QPVGGSGVIGRAGGATDWTFRGVDVSVGTAHIQLDGGMGEAPDLVFKVQADDLSIIDPDARGKIIASGRFAGTRDQPLVRVQAEGEAFDWRGYQLAALVADIDLDLATEQQRARGTLVLQGLQIGAR